MNYYDTFLKISKPPSDYHRNQIQELVYSQFDNASTYYEDVEEEVKYGSLEFTKCNVRINTLVDAKTGQRVNEDYKKIIYKDLNYKPELGTRYRFDENIWIIFSTDNIKTDTSSAYLRRCNNTINIQDIYGNIHNEPCYIDYKVTETQPFREYSIDVPNGRIWVQCQLNDWTKNFDVNSRFIFGGTAYKVREIHKFDRQKTFEKETSHLISFYADYDLIAPDDNLELEVANFKDYNYEIVINNSIVGKSGDSGVLDYKIQLNGKDIEEPVYFDSSNNNIAIIDENGRYELIVDGNCSFIISLKNNKNISKSIDVNVKNDLEDNYETVISPNIRNIKLNRTQKYSVYEYLNNNITDTKFLITCSGVPENYYEFYYEGNEFYITNLKQSDSNLLKVDCKNLRNNESIIMYIKLGGVF